MSERKQLEFLHKCRKSLKFHAKSCLKVRPKGINQPLIPFEFNTPQEYIDARLEEQLATVGMVRAIILKGRQQGCSTYVAGRFYSKASLLRGTGVYILSHEQSASDNLFAIVERYHRNNPIAPKTGVSNVKELEFEKLDSSYIVATAGNKAGGRSRTITLFHGSEVAFWKNPEEHFASSVQTVPALPGTEVILESTACGTSGLFYEKWQDAVRGIGDYIAIFVPWFWSKEYRRDDIVERGGFELSDQAEDGMLSEVEYAEAYGLDLGQMAWRRSKVAELGAKLFMQEYPATAEEAFQTSQSSSFIEAIDVLRARKRKGVSSGGPLIMGVDPAGPGGDRFAVAMRRGHVCKRIEWRDKIESVEAVEWLKALIDEHHPALVNVDAGGIGASVISHLRAKGTKYARLVKSVNFASTSQAKLAKPKAPGPKNRRAEMWERMKNWLKGDDGPVSLPDLDALQGDMTAPMLKPTTTNDILLESKDEMKKRGVRSPDLADSLALTFASLAHIPNWEEESQQQSPGEPDAPPALQPIPGVPGAYEAAIPAGRTGWMG